MRDQNKEAATQEEWKPKSLERIRRAPEPGDVAGAFLDAVLYALSVAGTGAIEFLAANPGLSLIDIAGKLPRQGNKWVSAIGLANAIYNEAVKKGSVREVAKDLLVRQVVDEFPEGWVSNDEIGPFARIRNWEDPIHDYVGLATIEYSRNIIRHLAIEHQPPGGWKPQLQNDPLIDELFDLYWPQEAV